MSEPKRVSPEEAKRLMDEEGYVYVDVRSIPEFEEGHPEGAYNVPLLHRGTGGMQPNPDFMKVVEAVFPKDSKLVLGCRSGGRSLRAAKQMLQAGYQDVIDQRAGWVGASDAFGQKVEEGWEPKGLPAKTGAEPDRDYDTLANKAK